MAAIMPGIILGALAVIFKDITEGFACFVGGFCLSMWFLVLRSGGLITSEAGKVIFIALLTAGAFLLYISHHTRPYGLIGSTSFGGATVIVLGTDCFSRAGLKEFWVYIWSKHELLISDTVSILIQSQVSMTASSLSITIRDIPSLVEFELRSQL